MKLLIILVKHTEQTLLLKFNKGYPATINHKKQSDFAYNVAKKLMVKTSSNLQNPMMGSEDFFVFS